MSGDGGQPDPLGVQADPAGPVPEFFFVVITGDTPCISVICTTLYPLSVCCSLCTQV